MSITNANNNPKLNDYDEVNCVQFAFDLEEIIGEMDYETFDSVVELCEEHNEG